MERRTLLSLFAAGPAAVLLAACGSDQAGTPPETAVPLPPVTEPPTTELTPATTLPAPPAEITALLEYGAYGGFTTREVAFQMQPQVLVTSDGRVITPAVTTAIYPGPLLPSDNVQSITPDGVEVLIAAATEAGLLADVEYPTSGNIADASTTTVRITAGGDTYVHEAYALGMGGLGDELELGGIDGRAGLESFVQQLADLPALVGADALGPAEPYVADRYQMIAEPVGDLAGYEPAPTVVEWPAGSDVVLAEARNCVEVDAATLGGALLVADQLTFFEEGGVTYQVIARPAYPGRSC